LLVKIPGNGSNNNYQGHSNIINYVDACPTNPHIFISCSDDETVKIWGVKELIDIDTSSLLPQKSRRNSVQQVFVDAKKEG